MTSGTVLWMFWGHTGMKWEAFFTSDQEDGCSGGANRFSPTGGAAYGTPRYWFTGRRTSLGTATLWPRSFPYWVVTVGAGLWEEEEEDGEEKDRKRSHHRRAQRVIEEETTPLWGRRGRRRRWRRRKVGDVAVCMV